MGVGVTLVAWVGWAFAAEPLVFTGAEADALERAAAATRLAPGDLAPTPVSALREANPTVGSGGALDACGGAPVTREQLVLAVQGAESALVQLDLDRARNELSRVADAERCAQYDAPLLGRYFATRGALGEDAAESFARARRLQPQLAWSEDWPADQRAAFDAATPAPPVVFEVAQPGYSVDGAPAMGRLELATGWHRVSGPGFDGAVHLDADGAFVVPSQMPTTAFDSLDTESSRFVPTRVLAAHFGEGARVFVANDRGVWAATAGRVDWLSLQAQRRHPLVGAGVITAVVGAVATAGTSAFTAIAAGQANAALDDARAGGPLEPAESAVGTYRVGVGATVGAGALTAVGLGLIGVGFSLGPQTVGGGS